MISLLWYSLGVLAILLMILLTPIGFSLSGSYHQTASLRGKVGWAGGIISLEVLYRQGKVTLAAGVPGLVKTFSPRRGKTEAKDRPRGARKARKPALHLSSLTERAFLQAIGVVLGKMWRALHLRLNITGCYGFGDPSLTGLVMAIISSLAVTSPSINLYPDFSGEATELDGDAGGYLIPLQIIVIAVLFLLARPVRTVWWPMITMGKKQKEAVHYA